MGRVVEDWAKPCLARPVTTSQGTHEAVAAVEAAIDQAEALLGHPLLQDVVDQATGELIPVVVVTDDGPAYRWVGFACFVASRPELLHVRTRHRSPQTMGVDCRSRRPAQRWVTIPGAFGGGSADHARGWGLAVECPLEGDRARRREGGGDAALPLKAARDPPIRRPWPVRSRGVSMAEGPRRYHRGRRRGRRCG
jgi:hypothetical protein